MAARKKKNKRNKKNRSRPSQARPSQPPPYQRGNLDPGIVIVPSTGEKMSEVLQDFMQPFLHENISEDGLRKVLTLGLIAWNAAILPDNQREEFIQDMVKTVPLEARPAMRALINDLMQRKRAHFASNRRMLLDVQVSMTPTGPYINVASTPNPV